MSILSEELLKEYGDDATEEDYLILAGNKKKAKDKKKDGAASAPRRLSKSELKKQKMVEIKKQKAASRKEILNSLSQNSLSEEQRILLHSSKMLGQEESTRQKLSRAMRESKAGITVSDGIDKLFVQKESVEARSESDSEQSIESSNKRKQNPEEIDIDEEVLDDIIENSDDFAESSSSHHNLAGSDNIVYARPMSDVKVLASASEENSILPKKKKKRRTVIIGTPLEESSAVPADNASEMQVQDTVSQVNVEELNHKASLLNSLNLAPKLSVESDISIPQSVQTTSSNLTSKKKFYISVVRDEKIEEQRRKLPIYGEEQTLIEAINANPFVVVCGATGSGKTTQLPQFLLENGYGFNESGHPGLIGITQPRRVAAVSTAKRVAHELGDHGKLVGYHIRYDSTADDKKTKIKFMTDGILLKEIQSDFLLLKYSVILVDEAHERNLNTDVLIGLLSRIVLLREKKSHASLKVVIMSATLRVSDFTENKNLFSHFTPPVIEIGARQFPVTIHFNRVTPISNYIDAAYKKICKIHSRLPSGGILVFLTGKQEIEHLCRKLRKGLKQNDSKVLDTDQKDAIENNEEAGEESGVLSDSDDENAEEEIDVAKIPAVDEKSDEFTEVEEDFLLESMSSVVPKVRVLPLYGLLSTELQMKVFDESVDPKMERLIVVATNVAETSITIPGIKYVVDCGREKTKVYDRVTGMSTFVIDWISKASADQRSGRAGRIGPGHCYRLYSSAVYNDRFSQFSAPEILSIPIDGMILQMKSMGIKKVVEFPFPTPPESDALSGAITTLKNLGALDSETENITSLGETLAMFPVSPRYSKMLALSNQGNCMDYVIALVAAMSVGNIWIEDSFEIHSRKGPESSSADSEDDDLQDEAIKSEIKSKRQRAFNEAQQFWSHRKSDLLSDLNVVCAFDYAEDVDDFCSKNFLRKKSLLEIQKLRLQLSRLIRQNLSKSGLELNDDRFAEDADDELNEDEMKKSVLSFSKHTLRLSPLTEDQEILICQIIASGFIDQIARKWSDLPENIEYSEDGVQKGAYECISVSRPVFIHPQSYLFDVEYQPEMLVYQELIQGSKTYMRGITAINLSLLSNIAKGTPLCRFSKPLESPPPTYDPSSDQIHCFVRGSFGPRNWRLSLQKIPFPRDDKQIYSIFAKLFLEGEILPELSHLKSCWKIRPQTLVSTSLERHSTHTQNLLMEFIVRGISSKHSLLVNLAHLSAHLVHLIRPSHTHQLVSLLTALQHP
jgi:ATP-dependent RNA helicase DHX37/DHR1